MNPSSHQSFALLCRRATSLRITATVHKEPRTTLIRITRNALESSSAIAKANYLLMTTRKLEIRLRENNASDAWSTLGDTYMPAFASTSIAKTPLLALPGISLRALPPLVWWLGSWPCQGWRYAWNNFCAGVGFLLMLMTVSQLWVGSPLVLVEWHQSLSARENAWNTVPPLLWQPNTSKDPAKNETKEDLIPDAKHDKAKDTQSLY